MQSLVEEQARGQASLAAQAAFSAGKQKFDLFLRHRGDRLTMIVTYQC